MNWFDRAVRSSWWLLGSGLIPMIGVAVLLAVFAREMKADKAELAKLRVQVATCACLSQCQVPSVNVQP